MSHESQLLSSNLKISKFITNPKLELKVHRQSNHICHYKNVNIKRLINPSYPIVLCSNKDQHRSQADSFDTTWVPEPACRLYHYHPAVKQDNPCLIPLAKVHFKSSENGSTTNVSCLDSKVLDFFFKGQKREFHSCTS